LRSKRWPQWALAVIVLIYLGVGSAYSVTTPVFEAPDESFHFFVVKHILDHRALPVQHPEAPGPWEQEGSQPPLYYIASALLVASIDTSDAESLLWANPQANIGDPANPGNKNRYIHPHAQDYPWRGSVLAVHVLRFFSLALGAVTVILIAGIARRIYPESAVLPLAVATTSAFMPQFLFITSAVNNDNAMTCLSTLALYLLIGRLRAGLSITTASGEPGRKATRAWVGLGVVLGLALLAKLSALVLAALVGAVVAWYAWRRRSWQVFCRTIVAVCGPTLLIAGWWYVRNALLYGDPTGLTTMLDIVGGRQDFGQDLWGEFRGLRYSFWGLFGWFSIPMSRWVYGILDALALLALVGVVAKGIAILRHRAWEQWLVPSTQSRGAAWARDADASTAYRPMALLMLGVWVAMTLASLVRWTSLTHGSQGRLLYPAIASLSLYFVLGLRWCLGRNRLARDVLSVVVAGAMFALGASALYVWIAPPYERPAAVAALPADAVPLGLELGDGIVLHGVRFAQATVRPGDVLTINLYWEALRPWTEADELMVWLRMIKERPDPQDKARGMVALEDSYPGSGTFPVSLWPNGQMLESRQHILVGEDVAAPMIARLDIALYRAEDGRKLVRPGADLPTIGRVKIVPQRWPRVGKQESLASFECGAALARAEVERAAEVGGPLRVRLTWTVQSPPRRDYVVFVHLQDVQGRIWGYGDGAPRGGNYPTWWWSEGEVIVDDHVVDIAADTPPGMYSLKVGLYNGDGRVPAFGPDGSRFESDAVDLGSVEVR